MEEVEEEQKITTVTDGVFTMTVGPSLSSGESATDLKTVNNKVNIFSPSPRMNSGLIVKNGNLFLYGGLVEDDDKQYTLADMYSLGRHKA
mgnify:FL=1